MPMLPLARALADAQHDVGFCSAPHFELPARHGFAHFPVGPDWTRDAELVGLLRDAETRSGAEHAQFMLREIFARASGVRCLPDLAEIERRRQAERKRLPKAQVDLKAFWRDYLLGRNRSFGMELLTATSPYRSLMQTQLNGLDARPGQRVADLGSGTGAFPAFLSECMPDLALHVDEIDYVREALERARERHAATGNAGRLTIRYLECDLDLLHHGRTIPVADASYDCVLASLLLNYLQQPSRLLKEAHRLLRPGGRIVLSTLRRDADISRIYQDVSSELRAGEARRIFGEEAERHLGESLHEFLNEAARLLDLEERGIFHFWGADELSEQLRKVGFASIASEVTFGDPPQAIVVSAIRP